MPALCAHATDWKSRLCPNWVPEVPIRTVSSGELLAWWLHFPHEECHWGWGLFQPAWFAVMGDGSPVEIMLCEIRNPLCTTSSAAKKKSGHEEQCASVIILYNRWQLEDSRTTPHVIAYLGFTLHYTDLFFLQSVHLNPASFFSFLFFFKAVIPTLQYSHTVNSGWKTAAETCAQTRDVLHPLHCCGLVLVHASHARETQTRRRCSARTFW